MTREEAIKVLNNFPIDFRHSGGFEAMEALKIAVLALRPVSREQVEKVWRKCEWCNGEHSNNGEINAYAEVECEGCDAGDNCPNAHSSDDPCYEMVDKALPVNFCPNCGAPMTDEAVEMVMKRWEAVKDGKGD